MFKYSSPDLDKWLTEARASLDNRERKRLYDDAQRLLACQGPAVHVAYGTLFTAVRDDVTGFEPVATRSLRGLRDVRLGR